MGARFVQEVAEVEQGVSRCQKLEESLQTVRNTPFNNLYTSNHLTLWIQLNSTGLIHAKCFSNGE